ncbi:hypothetical protein DFH27DRAFT_526453 [Peziza echinospora]|nr:hypothetical protein DFH27DRAFT_526453 [Peziza echinospora]
MRPSPRRPRSTGRGRPPSLDRSSSWHVMWHACEATGAHVQFFEEKFNRKPPMDLLSCPGHGSGLAKCAKMLFCMKGSSSRARPAPTLPPGIHPVLNVPTLRARWLAVLPRRRPPPVLPYSCRPACHVCGLETGLPRVREGVRACVSGMSCNPNKWHPFETSRMDQGYCLDKSAALLAIEPNHPSSATGIWSDPCGNKLLKTGDAYGNACPQVALERTSLAREKRNLMATRDSKTSRQRQKLSNFD